MLSNKEIIKNPLAEAKFIFNGFPNSFERMLSTQLWYYFESDMLEKVVALRVYPYQNYMAMKVKFKYAAKYISISLSEPELRILKCLWDCGHEKINEAIRSYLIHSSSTYQQWAVQTSQNKHCFDWYANIGIGRNE